MQPSVSVSTSGVPSQGSGGGGVARRFKGRTVGVSRLTKFQLVGGKDKKAASKGTKSSKRRWKMLKFQPLFCYSSHFFSFSFCYSSHA